MHARLAHQRGLGAKVHDCLMPVMCLWCLNPEATRLSEAGLQGAPSNKPGGSTCCCVIFP